MIVVEQVKKLRKITGMGMVACKRALDLTNGNEQLAIQYLKWSSLAVNHLNPFCISCNCVVEASNLAVSYGDKMKLCTSCNNLYFGDGEMDEATNIKHLPNYIKVLSYMEETGEPVQLGDDTYVMDKADNGDIVFGILMKNETTGDELIFDNGLSLVQFMNICKSLPESYIFGLSASKVLQSMNKHR